MGAERTRASAGDKQENERAQHGEVGASIADHEPEALIGAEKFGNFRCSDGRRYDDEERDGSKTGPKAQKHEQAAKDFEGPDEMSREQWMRETDARESNYPEIRVGKFQNTLREKNQSRGNANEDDSGGAFCRAKEKLAERCHFPSSILRSVRRGTARFDASLSYTIAERCIQQDFVI
jgi:hypothetical protein